MTKRDESSDGRQGRLEESRQEGGREEESLKARLDRLSTALDAQAEADKASGATKTGQDGASPGAIGKAMSLAIRVLSEFVAAVMVGTAMGWGIDHIAGTSPAFLIVFLLFGAAAGFWNVYRIAMKPPGKENE